MNKKKKIMSEDKRIDPRWEIVNELYDYIDKGITELGTKNEMNFIEINMALVMINKKIEYEQFKAMLDFNIEGIAKEKQEKDTPKDLYR